MKKIVERQWIDGGNWKGGFMIAKQRFLVIEGEEEELGEFIAEPVREWLEPGPGVNIKHIKGIVFDIIKTTWDYLGVEYCKCEDECICINLDDKEEE